MPYLCDVYKKPFQVYVCNSCSTNGCKKNPWKYNFCNLSEWYCEYIQYVWVSHPTCPHPQKREKPTMAWRVSVQMISWMALILKLVSQQNILWLLEFYDGWEAHPRELILACAKSPSNMRPLWILSYDHCEFWVVSMSLANASLVFSLFLEADADFLFLSCYFRLIDRNEQRSSLWNCFFGLACGQKSGIRKRKGRGQQWWWVWHKHM